MAVCGTPEYAIYINYIDTTYARMIIKKFVKNIINTSNTCLNYLFSVFDKTTNKNNSNGKERTRQVCAQVGMLFSKAGFSNEIYLVIIVP